VGWQESYLIGAGEHWRATRISFSASRIRSGLSGAPGVVLISKYLLQFVQADHQQRNEYLLRRKAAVVATEWRLIIGFLSGSEATTLPGHEDRISQAHPRRRRDPLGLTPQSRFQRALRVESYEMLREMLIRISGDLDKMPAETRAVQRC